MINNLRIEFDYCRLHHTIKIDDWDDYGNLPYNLAAAFEEVINKSDANSDIVIKELIETFDYKDNEQEE